MSQIRVLFDAGGFQNPFDGVSFSFTEMIKHLPANIEPQLAIRNTCNVALQGEPFKVPGHPDLYHHFITSAEFHGKWRLWRLAQRMFPSKFPDYEADNSRELEARLGRGDFEVLHLTGPHTYGAAWRNVVGKKPFVITVHDLIPEIINHSVRVETSRREVLQAASHVIAVSEYTKQDLIRLYGVPEEKVSVVHHGYEFLCASNGHANVFRDGYILYVGGRGGYKNWAWMVQTIAPLLREGRRLVCTGMPFTSAERGFLKKLKVVDYVSQQYVSADEFPVLFASASAFVYPSQYEGFGLPILDAFAAGCPVVLSRSSCFPEIAGDGAAYFGLGHSEELCAELTKILKDDGYRTSLIAKGKKRLSMYSWKKTGEAVARIYEKVARDQM